MTNEVNWAPYSKENYDLERYKLPKGMRYSTLKEREEFYKEEFNLDRVGGWLENVMEKPCFRRNHWEAYGNLSWKVSGGRLYNDPHRRV